MDCTVGILVSGIAGPGGSTPVKPVELVWIGLSSKEGNHVWQFIWNGDRIQNKEQSARAVWLLLFDYLNGKLLPDKAGDI